MKSGKKDNFIQIMAIRRTRKQYIQKGDARSFHLTPKATLWDISGVTRAPKVPANQQCVALKLGDSDYLRKLAYSMPLSQQGVLVETPIAAETSITTETATLRG